MYQFFAIFQKSRIFMSHKLVVPNILHVAGLNTTTIMF